MIPLWNTSVNRQRVVDRQHSTFFIRSHIKAGGPANPAFSRIKMYCASGKNCRAQLILLTFWLRRWKTNGYMASGSAKSQASTPAGGGVHGRHTFHWQQKHKVQIICNNLQIPIDSPNSSCYNSKQFNYSNRWSGDNGNYAFTESLLCRELGKKQVVKWTAEGAVKCKRIYKVFCDVAGRRHLPGGMLVPC